MINSLNPKSYNTDNYINSSHNSGFNDEYGSGYSKGYTEDMNGKKTC